ncbi:hypothetical protein M422DRAFT_162401, partial [Sphaerobolus stellatus SS14]
APAREALEYEVRVFEPGMEHQTIYQGASDEVDKAWGDLYNHTVMKIPKQDMALMANKSWPIKDEPGYYLGLFDVFHQLHCLDSIRRTLHKDYYGVGEHHNYDMLEPKHAFHCVEYIRQALMCNPDVSMNVWNWYDDLKGVRGSSHQAHTCVNFSKLQEWARERQISKFINTTEYIEDDLPDPPIIH